MKQSKGKKNGFYFDKVVGLGPKLSTATIFFHEAVASRLKLNATDMKCLTFIANAKDPVVAGDIATYTGLTTGAITGVLDRLEKAGLVKRVQDEADRRKVFLQTDIRAFEKIRVLYSSLRSSVEALASTYSEAELATISDFLEKSVHLLGNEADKLRK